MPFWTASDATVRSRRSWVPWLPVGMITLLGCAGPQSMFEGAGAESARILKLWWILFGTASIAILAVFAYLLLGILRSLRGDAGQTSTAALRRTFIWSSALTAALLLFALLPVFEYASPTASSEPSGPLIEVVARRWWWSIRYFDDEGQLLFETANELHLPVGLPMRLRLTSSDIIHSFWIPALAGKMDLIPGHRNYLEIEATKTGRFRGQCAEYCGLQHALMAFWVTVHPPSEYSAWLAAQQFPAREPQTPLAEEGRTVFRRSTCGTCHRIRGVTEPILAFEDPARGPDLTHLMSRSSIAAGTLPNTKGHLAAWIANSQGIKPGNFMPRTMLRSEQFNALLHYLETLE